MSSYVFHRFSVERKITICCFLIHSFIRANQDYEDEHNVVNDDDDDDDDKRFDPCSGDVDDIDENAAIAWRDGISIGSGFFSH